MGESKDRAKFLETAFSSMGRRLDLADGGETGILLIIIP